MQLAIIMQVRLRCGCGVHNTQHITITTTKMKVAGAVAQLKFIVRRACAFCLLVLFLKKEGTHENENKGRRERIRTLTWVGEWVGREHQNARSLTTFTSEGTLVLVLTLPPTG